MKLAIVVGHNPRQPGAVRCDTGEAEYQWNSRIAMMIEDMVADGEFSGIKVKTFFRRPVSNEIRAVYAEVDDWNPDMAIELHFNSVKNPKANGCEMLSSGSKRSLELADALQKAVVRAFAVRSRGVKIPGAKGRGYASLHSGKAPAVILEPYFGSNAKDCEAFGPDREHDYAREILEAVEAVGQEWGLLDIQAASLPAQKLDTPSLWSAILQFLKGWKR